MYLTGQVMAKNDKSWVKRQAYGKSIMEGGNKKLTAKIIEFLS
jgi:hypothetical protein